MGEFRGHDQTGWSGKENSENDYMHCGDGWQDEQNIVFTPHNVAVDDNNGLKNPKLNIPVPVPTDLDDNENQPKPHAHTPNHPVAETTKEPWIFLEQYANTHKTEGVKFDANKHTLQIDGKTFISFPKTDPHPIRTGLKVKPPYPPKYPPGTCIISKTSGLKSKEVEALQVILEKGSYDVTCNEKQALDLIKAAGKYADRLNFPALKAGSQARIAAAKNAALGASTLKHTKPS